MQPPDRIRLQDMLDCARRAHEFASAVTTDAFRTDDMRNLACARCLEILGEAASKVGPDVRESLPEIPWATLRGMRNVLVHDYGRVDVGIVWTTATRDLPPLIARLEDLLSST